MYTNWKLFSFLLIALIVVGMVVVMNGVGVNISHLSGQQCYDQLNAAGQVVGSFCQ